VGAFVTVGTSLADWKQVQRISTAHACVYHTVGIHPHEAMVGVWKHLEEVAQHPKCCAIGEIGLDYYYKNQEVDIQLECLKEQLAFAAHVGKPVVIHSREAEDELLGLLEDHVKLLSADAPRGVIHCFSGTQAFGQACLDLGFYLSFSGILTFQKAEEVREAARWFPLDSLLVETDAPFLAPVPFRGRKSDPAMVRLTAETLAQVKGLSFEEVASTTTRNACRVFQIPESVFFKA